MATGEWPQLRGEASFQSPVEKEMWKEQQQAGRRAPKLHAGTDVWGPDVHVDRLGLLQSDTHAHTARYGASRILVS